MSQTNASMGLGTPNIESDVEMLPSSEFGYYEAVQQLIPQSANIAALANPLAQPVRSVTPPEPESTYDNIPDTYEIIVPALTKAQKREKEMDENRRILFAFNKDDERIDYIRSVLGLDEDDDDPEEVAGLTEGDLIEAGAELLTDQMSGGSKKKAKKAKKTKAKTKKTKAKAKANKKNKKTKKNSRKK